MLIMETSLYLPLLFIPQSPVRSVSRLTQGKLLQHWAEKDKSRVSVKRQNKKAIHGCVTEIKAESKESRCRDGE